MSGSRAGKLQAPEPKRPAAPASGSEATWEAEANRFALGFLAREGGFSLPRPSAGNDPQGVQSLPGGVRSSAEALFDRDFSGVRLRPGARDLGSAHAETSGNEIRLAPGRFRPEHPLGRALLVHELAHVAQQGAAPPRTTRPPGGFGPALARRRVTDGGAQLDAQVASVTEPGSVDLTPAPRGLRQRSDSWGDDSSSQSSTKAGPGQDAGLAADADADADAADPAPFVPSAADIPAALRDNYADIDTQVAALNQRMNPPTPLDPDWLRAMQGTETVAGTDPRKYDPLQIANKGDTALSTLQGAGTTDLAKEDTKRLRESGILDSSVSTALAGKKQTPRKDGQWDYSALKESERMSAGASITGGAAWLFAKAVSKYKTVNVETGDRSNPKEHEVVSGDSLAKIAKAKGTTVTTLQKMNPGAKVLHPGDKLKYVEAHAEYRVETWKSWEQAVKDYNGGGDPDYFKKVKAKYDEIKAARTAAERAFTEKQ